MSRHITPKKRSYTADPNYKSILVNIIVNRLIRHGKKRISYRILYSVLEQIHVKTQREPLAVLEYAIFTITPTVRLKSRRVGGTTYHVPMYVSPFLGTTIAIRWILSAASTRPGRGISNRLTAEILDILSGNGGSVRKREETQRIAESNKAFTRYRF